jgi:hypothetical protein
MTAVPAQFSSIDEAISAMDRNIDRCLEGADRAGFFAAMYRAVTARVKQGIEDGWFDDCDRMERFDVLFAHRYLDACRRWEAGSEVTDAWRLAFETSERSDCIALQHLLLGINAHINLDLGIAAADAVGQVRSGSSVTTSSGSTTCSPRWWTRCRQRLRQSLRGVGPWTGSGSVSTRRWSRSPCAMLGRVRGSSESNCRSWTPPCGHTRSWHETVR